MTSKPPHQSIEWTDPDGTGAIGWIVIHNEVDGVSGGGLFMDESATLNEVQDLARTMSLKNSLQKPLFGGGKGGIRFSPHSPYASGVLDRFLRDHKSIIQHKWCTGGDLHTTTPMITDSLQRMTGLPSPFIALANAVERQTEVSVNMGRFHDLLSMEVNAHFSLDGIVVGYSMESALSSVLKPLSKKPKVVIQGFGKVGRGAVYRLQETATIVGVCERDWSVYNPAGLNIDDLLNHILPSNTCLRRPDETSPDFLARFLTQARADVFCPCAVRYSVTEEILGILHQKTFIESSLGQGFIIAGSNNIFSHKNLILNAAERGIVVIPEWVSNAGSALLFMEALKYQGSFQDWPSFIQGEIKDRIHGFLTQAKVRGQRQHEDLYTASLNIAHEKIYPLEKVS